MDQKRIGKCILENRKIKGLTQQELASLLGVTNRTIINWEKGKCMPDYSLLIPLCEILEITVSEFLTGERDDDKTNSTVELILNYLDRNRSDNLEGYNKVGKILLLLGIILTIIAVQIPVRDFTATSFLNSLIGMYPIIGIIFSFVGFKFINKRYHFKKRFILNFVYLFCSILFLIIVDLISIYFYNAIPRYYMDDITNAGTTGIIYLETPFYDAYACYDWNFKIILPSTKNYSYKDADYLRDKYCDNMENDNGGGVEE